MSTTFIFGEGSQFFIQFPSGQTHLLAYVLVAISTMLLTWFGLTLAINKPPVSKVPSAQSPCSFELHASTVVVEETVRVKAAKETQKEEMDDEEFVTFSNPFSVVSAPVKMSRKPSLALHPFARRLSMPGREPSTTPTHSFHHVVTPLRQRSTIRRHGSLDDDEESYFPPPHVSSGKVRVIPDDENDHRVTECVPSEVMKRGASIASVNSAKKLSKMKRVVKKATAIFHLPHRS
ncbi:hypothetical protein H0H92_001160 [Tricholoma furcatifolium]|nr:hypothetical protein H0H92_001160 [Tricholoma furcatifolium]